ncbi:MAG: hypothetical protein ACSHX6_05575 [Akkermansiaceae bacterium]
MIPKNINTKALLATLAPLVIISLESTTHAQETKENKPAEENLIAPDSSELLKKGNTWTYAVSVQIPDEVKFESTLKDPGEKTKRGMIYRYEEIQQSAGLKEVEALKRKAPQINVFIDGKLSKKQILEYREGALYYFGTYHHDPENPDLKKGMISVNPILLYNEKSEVADKWSWTATGLPDFQFRIVDKANEIEIQGTKYIADKIQMDQIIKGSNKIIQSKEIWFTKDIGVVKEREKNYVANGQAIIKTLELKSFINNLDVNKIK